MKITELIFLALFSLVLFGPDELPKIAKYIGQVIKELKEVYLVIKEEASSVQKDIFKDL